MDEPSEAPQGTPSTTATKSHLEDRARARAEAVAWMGGLVGQSQRKELLKSRGPVAEISHIASFAAAILEVTAQSAGEGKVVLTTDNLALVRDLLKTIQDENRAAFLNGDRVLAGARLGLNREDYDALRERAARRVGIPTKLRKSAGIPPGPRPRNAPT